MLARALTNVEDLDNVLPTVYFGAGGSECLVCAVMHPLFDTIAIFTSFKAKQKNFENHPKIGQIVERQV